MEHLTKSIEDQSDEELLDRLRQIRHNREVARPVAQKVVERAEKKASTKRTNTLSDLFAGMTEEEKAAFIKQLEGG